MVLYYRQHDNIIIVSGKTYPYKEDIKACGGQYRGPEKVWSVPTSPQNLDTIKHLCQRVGGGPVKIKKNPEANKASSLDAGEISSRQVQEIQTPKLGLSISELMHKVHLHIQQGFPGTVWIVGEIQSLNIRHTGTYLQLADFKEGASKSATMTVNATLWKSTADALQRKLKGALGDILQEGMKIRALVQVGFYKDRGSVSLNILDLDSDFTKGALALQREIILKELRAKGLDRKNKALSLSLFPFKIGLLSAEGSRAKSDFLDQLAVYKFPGELVFVATQMQGEKTVDAVVRGIQKLTTAGCDLIVITRGGGSNADLRWFDDRNIAMAIAASPIPIIAAIGHHDDICIAEEIAYAREKTPTAAADFIIAVFGQAQERISRAQQAIFRLASERIHLETKVQMQRYEQVKSLSERYLSHTSEHLAHLSSQIQGQYHRTVATLDAKVLESKQTLQLLCQRHLDRHGQFLFHIQYNLMDRFKGITTHLEAKITGIKQSIFMAAQESLASQRDSLNSLHTKLVAKDPLPWLKQGWTQLTQDHKTILSSQDIVEDEPLYARLLDEKIKLKYIKEKDK